jgi:hypothetical protein
MIEFATSTWLVPSWVRFPPPPGVLAELPVTVSPVRKESGKAPFGSCSWKTPPP